MKKRIVLKTKNTVKIPDNTYSILIGLLAEKSIVHLSELMKISRVTLNNLKTRNTCSPNTLTKVNNFLKRIA